MYLSKYRITLFVILLCILSVMIILGLIWFTNPFEPSFIDSDEDGVMNDSDIFPDDPQEQNDSDGDGIGDNQDSFPFDPSASIDTDEDGFPNRWNPGKSQEDSTSQPVLKLDDFPYDPTEWTDSDKDGIGDNADVFSNDPGESRDDDGDNIGNNADHNPFVDLSFTFSLESITLLKHVDILPWAQIYIRVLVDGKEIVTWNNNGSYYYIWKNRPKSILNTFFYDIPETGSQNYTDIEIQVFDYDLIKKDELIDITKNNDDKNIKLRLYHQSNTLSSDQRELGNEAKIAYSITLPKEVEPSNEIIEKTFQWHFKNSFHKINLNIPIHKYEWALQSMVNRTPQSYGPQYGINKMRNFVTENDTVIISLANKLQNIASTKGYNQSETVNFVMSFVQHTITYQDDNQSKGSDEYWRYPIETLVDKQGDCEDTSVLFASIIENIGYDAVLLFYIIEDDIGHLATGVSNLQILNAHSITYEQKEYYYCETTSIGFSIGEKPNDIPDKPEEIIPIK